MWKVCRISRTCRRILHLDSEEQLKTAVWACRTVSRFPISSSRSFWGRRWQHRDRVSKCILESIPYGITTLQTEWPALLLTQRLALKDWMNERTKRATWAWCGAMLLLLLLLQRWRRRRCWWWWGYIHLHWWWATSNSNRGSCRVAVWGRRWWTRFSSPVDIHFLSFDRVIRYSKLTLKLRSCAFICLCVCTRVCVYPRWGIHAARRHWSKQKANPNPKETNQMVSM